MQRDINCEIRSSIKKNNLFLYEVAKQLGISEFTFCRWLREELQGERKERVLAAIAQLKKQ